MAEAEAWYRAAERRIEWLTLAFGAAASVGVWLHWDWRAAAALALGAALSWINYRWLKQGVKAFSQAATAQAGEEKVRIPKLIYVKFFGRFALLLAAVYVILASSWLPGGALLAGLFAVVAAVMAEMIYQLLRAARRPTHG